MITGKVVIWNDIPLENISISAQKSKTKIVSDRNGEFSIQINKKDKLRFLAEGFINKRVAVKPGEKKIVVKMELVTKNYSEEDELANDGFRHIPKQFRAKAISRLKMEVETEMASYNSVWDMIKGRCPGVVVNDNQVFMREGLTGNLSGQSQPAIIVINGVQVPSSSLDDVDPRDVKSVSLLKGGAAAVYGGSGGNGVVVIKTK